MKTTSAIITFAFLLVNACVAQPSQKPLTISQQHEDYDLLRKAMEEAHGGLYRYVGKNAMDVFFQTFREELNKPITKRGFISVVSELLAEIHDGHTRLEYDQEITNDLSAAKVFPLQLHIQSDGIIKSTRAFVLFNDSPTDQSVLPGAEIISINDQAFTDIYGTLVLKQPGDGYVRSSKAIRIERNFGSQYWMFINMTATFRVVAKNPDGKNITVNLSGILQADRSSNRNKNPVNASAQKNVSIPNTQGENITAEFTKGNVAILRIRSFGGEDFREQLDAKFLSFKEKKVKGVILDLRNNGGGVDEYGAYLVSQFTSKPFRYFDRIELATIDPSFTRFTSSTYENLKTGTTSYGGDLRDARLKYLVKPELHSGVGKQQPATNSFDGKVIVLTNGATFSTAADVTAILKDMKRATFVGEETGGGFFGNTSGLNARVVLPNSGLTLRVQMYNYWNAVSAESNERDRGTMPHHPVTNTIADILAGTDRQMEMALKLVVEPGN